MMALLFTPPTTYRRWVNWPIFPGDNIRIPERYF